MRGIADGSAGLAPGRALDVGCGSGPDAVLLAKHGWQVTGVDIVDKALAEAKQRAADEGVEVQWVAGDVTKIAGLGLEPGFDLIYDFGCIHGLPDRARADTAAGLTELAAPGATLLVLAFKRGRRIVLPRGMDEGEIVELFGDWKLVDSEPQAQEDMPPPIRRARPTLYRLARKGTG